MKTWTEPNGEFTIDIPIEWQYKNTVFKSSNEKSPYSFELYERPIGCFQISYGKQSDQNQINNQLPIQKENSQIERIEQKVNWDKLNLLLYSTRINDTIYRASYIYDRKRENMKKLIKEIQKLQISLKSFKIIPVDDKKQVVNINKYKNFHSSLAASYDLLSNAYENESHIELVVIISNQIDAFLRLSIVLSQQIKNKTDDIEVKYLFQDDNEQWIMERKIYIKAHELDIINSKTLEELNNLYDTRNKVIHRYVISYIKTSDIQSLVYKYWILSEEIRLTLQSYEEEQFGKWFGIYWKWYSKEYIPNKSDHKILNSLENDKHLIKKLQKKI